MADDAHDLDFAAAARAGVPLRIGTLSKALGGYGGYVAASQPVIDLIRNRARTLIYSTGLPPATLASAIAALDLIEREPACWRSRSPRRAPSRAPPICRRRRARSFRSSSARRRPRSMRRACWKTKAFWPIAIRPPTVPEGTARLRLTFCALHPDDDIARLAEIVRERILQRR